MIERGPTIKVTVDPTNPGQFFACCGLLELAGRLWPGSEGWFEQRQFLISGNGVLVELLREVCQGRLIQLDQTDSTSSPIYLDTPFNLRLDWWLDQHAGGRELKVWAGTMDSMRIARSMQAAVRTLDCQSADLFDIGLIAYDPDHPDKKVEPFYFDARRGPNAHSRDVGFSPNDLQLTTTAFPAVELLCLVGLQRCLPARTGRPRIFDYFTWSAPLPPELLPAAVSGLLPSMGQVQFRFETWFRTGQRKHKAFLSATPVFA